MGAHPGFTPTTKQLAALRKHAGGPGPTGRAEAEPERFTALWRNPRIAVVEIQLAFHYRSRESVYRAAVRMGLPRRTGPPGRQKGYAPTERQLAALRLAHLRRYQSVDCLSPAQEARIAAAMLRDDGPQPTCYRCPGCDGRSASREGHPTCRAA